MRISNVTLRKRIFIALLLGVIGFISLWIRLGYVQLWTGPELSQRAEDTWRRNIPFEAKRGEIVDRNGEQLAYNITSPSVLAIPVQIDDAKSTAKQLASILQISEEKVFGLITKKELIVRIQPGGRKISVEKAQEIRKLNLPGIVIAEDNERYYPYDNLASHVLGFTGIDNQGLTGIELTYDKYLTGTKGNISFLSDAKGDLMPNASEQYSAPKDGLTLQLTLDKNIQMIVERELDQAMTKYQPDSALAIVMDPQSGEILAMSTKPDYEPGNYAEYDSSIYNRNLPIWKTYEPGSTFKIITLAAALEENKVNLKQDTFHDPGAIEVAGARLRCWRHGGHGSQTFLEGVENSCNPAFVILGQRLGKETLYDYIKDFGFGTKTGIDLGGEENGILFNLDRVGPVELATTAFGQGVSVTPIQQVTAVSAAINGGTLYTPQVAGKWIHPETGEVVKEVEPKAVRTVISEETSKQVREALESVVANGTGRNAYIDGYRVGGKTGTAQKVINGRYSPNEHIVSFIGFAPADDPQVVIYVAVDNPKGIQFGGVVAAPIVKNMMEDTLRYMKVEPREDQIEKEYKYGDIKYKEVPNLVGMTTTEIIQSLNPNFQLTKSGEGNVVVSQAPKAGERVEIGSTIRVYLSNKSE
ncbi:stage V sporulation protein D [Chengkuizengella sp. SCS-71B]|uniref:stage V sporulation protein D n=1 Tax=Chengkuizengella sp. SCS-71B TaxID=3115290 RepID=UPI0032C22EEF